MVKESMITPTDIPELLKPGRTILLPGRILVAPHGKMVWERKKKAILSSRLTEKYTGVPVYLIEGDKALGIIEIKKPRKITLEEAKKLREKHRISSSEMAKWWKNKKILYYYPVELISKFDPPKEIARPEGAQVWLQAVTFKSLDMVNPAEMTDEELLEAHKKLHKMWQETTGSKEDIMNYHILIIRELRARKLGHKEIDELDRKSKEFQERFSKSGYKITFYGSKGLVEEEGPGHRFHTSILYEFQGKKLLVDYGKINQGNIGEIKPDFLLVSHSHPDHLLGFVDSVVVISKDTEKEIPELHKNFNIDARAKYESYKTFNLGPFKIIPIPVFHSLLSKMHVFIIQMGDKKVLQATDILNWHSGDREKYVKDLDVVIIDGSSLTRTLARRKGKLGEPYGHSSITNQLKNWYNPENVRRIIVTHLGKEPLEMGDDELLSRMHELTKVPITIATDSTVINLSEDSAPIYTSGKVMGRRIYLKDVLPYFKNFMIQKPLIYLTGGLANQVSTRGDIDLLLPEWLSIDIRRIIEFRVARSVPWWIRRRLHFVYDKFSSPFTNAVPLYNLTMMRSKDRMLRLSEISEIEKGIRPAFGSPGGKKYLAKTIVSYIPDHKIYVEPFVGGGAIFFAKKPSEVEIINDKDSEIAFAYRFMKKGKFDGLEKFNWVANQNYFEQLKDSQPSSEIGRFHKFIYLLSFSRGDRKNYRHIYNGNKSKLPERLPILKERLKKIIIMNKDWKELVRKFDSSNTFFYFDPPYPDTTWLNEKTDISDLEEILKTLKGKFILSWSPRSPKIVGFPTRRVRVIRQDQERSDDTELLISNFSLKKTNIYLSETEKQLREKPRVAGALKDAEVSAREDRIKLFSYFLPLKPTRGYYPERRQTIELFIEVMEKMGNYPFFMERKFDGVNIEIHRDGDRIEIFSEDGNRVTSQFPKIIEAIKKLKGKKMVLMGELECWKDGKHLPREYSNGIMASKEIDDEDTVLNVYDCPFYDKDIHNRPFIERRKILEGLNFPQNVWETPPEVNKRLNLAGGFWVKNRRELEAGAEKLKKLEGSEGTVTKTRDFKYNLKGIRSGSVKYHVSTMVYGKVLEIKPTKVAGIRNFYFGLEPGKYKMKAEELGNVFYHRSGRTFSTSLKANVGDVLEIEGETLNAEHDLKDDTWRVSVWAPRVMRKMDRKADTIQEVIDRAKKNYCLQEKEITEEGKIIYLSEIEKQADPYMEYPKPEKKRKYVIQRHFRGAGSHIDIRVKHDGYLIGFTVADSIKGKPGEPITTLQQAKALNQNEISKIDWKKGVPKLRPGIKPGFKKKYAELAAMRKSREPEEWIRVSGVTPIGEVGATSRFPGVFHIIDKGYCEIGSNKSYFHEVFFSGGKLRGRWFFRQLRPAEFRGKVEKQEVIPPARETKFREEAPWFLVKPLDETPYILSKAAIKKNWISPFEISALPEHIRKQVPEKYRYWKFKEEKKRIAIRNELVEEKIIKLSEIIMKPYPNAHSCRLHSPKEYSRFFRQNCKIKHNEKCIDLVFGVKEGKSEVQAMRYPKNIWTSNKARNHCKSKEGTFEPAQIKKILNPGANWAKAAYHYVLSQQQLTLWVRTSLPEKVKRVQNALEDFKKLHPFRSEWAKDAIEWLEKRPNEMKEMIIDLLQAKKIKEIPFVLQWHFFRGPRVIRAGVSSEHWDLRLNFPGQPGLMHFVLNLNPLKNKEVTALWKPCKYKEWMEVSQYLPPANERAKMSREELAKLPPGIEEGNPTKSTSAYIKIIDKGKATVYEDSESFKKFGFKGKELKGLWAFAREGMSKFWVMSRSEMPKT